jgi:hypothetical protein
MTVKYFYDTHKLRFLFINFSAQLGLLVCEEEGSSNSPKITKIEDGSSFIRISPLGQSFTYVYLKPLDYEVGIIIL